MYQYCVGLLAVQSPPCFVGDIVFWYDTAPIEKEGVGRVEGQVFAGCIRRLGAGGEGASTALALERSSLLFLGVEAGEVHGGVSGVEVQILDGWGAGGWSIAIPKSMEGRTLLDGSSGVLSKSGRRRKGCAAAEGWRFAASTKKPSCDLSSS